MKTAGRRFELPRVRHAELVCRDLASTVQFYRDALGMRLVQTFDLPGRRGQRAVFDVGDGALLSFLWFGEIEPEERVGSELEPRLDGAARITAHGSIDYVRFDVSAERFAEYSQHMKARGVPTSLAFRRNEPTTCAGETVGRAPARRSLYCLDPDGLCLEFASGPAVQPRTPARQPTPAEKSEGRLAEPAYA